MKSLNKLLLILTSCLIINCEPILEAPPGYNNGEIQGTVFYDPDNDGNYEIAPNAKIKLNSMPGLPDGKPETTSNSQGYFEFKDIEPSDDHFVWAQKNIGNTYYEKILHFPVKEKSTTTLTLYLRKQF